MRKSSVDAFSGPIMDQFADCKRESRARARERRERGSASHFDRDIHGRREEVPSFYVRVRNETRFISNPFSTERHSRITEEN